MFINQNVKIVGVYVLVFIMYPIALCLSFHGYKKILFVAVIWSIFFGTIFASRYKKSQKWFFVFMFLVGSAVLNAVYGVAAQPQPADLTGFIIFWAIIQWGMFLTTVGLNSLGEIFNQWRNRS